MDPLHADSYMLSTSCPWNSRPPQGSRSLLPRPIQLIKTEILQLEVLAQGGSEGLAQIGRAAGPI